MANTKREDLIKAVAVTAELCGTELSDAAARMLVDDLSDYPIDQVFGSLKRCRHEMRGKLTLAEVVSRLDDGRPGPQEAWAQIPRGEGESCVWTAEMRTAFRVANPLIEAGDEIAARMAFLEAYQSEVAKARAEHHDPDWQVSLGFNHRDCLGADAGRRVALQEAVQRGRISHETATNILPEYEEQPHNNTPRLTNDNPTPASEAMQHIDAMKQLYGPTRYEGGQG